MAVEPANNETATQDIQAHVRDYAGFTNLFSYGAIAVFVIGIVVLFIIA
jgi:hypothetical protein